MPLRRRPSADDVTDIVQFIFTKCGGTDVERQTPTTYSYYVSWRNYVTKSFAKVHVPCLSTSGKPNRPVRLASCWSRSVACLSSAV
jgi:hypothetical protein